MDKHGCIIVSALLLSVVGLFLEQMEPTLLLTGLRHVLDSVILGLIVWEALSGIRAAAYRWYHIRRNAPTLLFVIGFSVFFLFQKAGWFSGRLVTGHEPLASLLRNGYLVLKIAGRARRLLPFTQRLAMHPAQTIVVSFLLVILAGTLLLLMPATTPDRHGLAVLDALFTATSAVCVTGLVVVDTARDLTLFGQLIVLTLIQIGGLGIMVFSFFGLFALGRRVSLKDKLTVSYMLSEDDMRQLSGSLRRIVLSTLAIEAAGAAILVVRFLIRGVPGGQAALYGIFHAISAFCNAGFALFSDSLESFRADPWIMLAVALLIVLGGISFGVIHDGRRAWQAMVRCLSSGLAGRPDKMPQGLTSSATLNTRVVLTITVILLAAGFGGFYLLEHEGVMAAYGLGEQYLSAFFQAVTLRTAGFNSVPFGQLRDATLLFMIGFMFIGGASGSTAGGIKVNTLVAIVAYFRSFLYGETAVRIGRSAISMEKVGRAFMILAFAFVAISAGAFTLSLTENAAFLPLLFEAVSAFGTVGLSAGITAGLSAAGKLVIIVLMFLGRLGPITILSAARRSAEQTALQYPEGDLVIV
jgi:trk system potassium uptake protein TrkH